MNSSEFCRGAGREPEGSSRPRVQSSGSGGQCLEQGKGRKKVRVEAPKIGLVRRQQVLFGHYIRKLLDKRTCLIRKF